MYLTMNIKRLFSVLWRQKNGETVAEIIIRITQGCVVYRCI